MFVGSPIMQAEKLIFLLNPLRPMELLNNQFLHQMYTKMYWCLQFLEANKGATAKVQAIKPFMSQVPRP